MTGAPKLTPGRFAGFRIRLDTDSWRFIVTETDGSRLIQRPEHEDELHRLRREVAELKLQLSGRT